MSIVTNPYVAPAQTSGFVYAAASDADLLVITGAGTLASGTVTMPANPSHRQRFSLSSMVAVTAVTVAPAAQQVLVGAPTTLVAGACAGRWAFFAPSGTWYPA